MHKWFDELQEPKRFIVFFIPAAIIIAGINIHHYGIDIVSIVLLSILAISRIIYMHKYTKRIMTFINKAINACRGGQ